MTNFFFKLNKISVKVRIVFIYGKRKGDHAWDTRVMEMIFTDLDHGYVDISHLFIPLCICILCTLSFCVILRKFECLFLKKTSPKFVH